MSAKKALVIVGGCAALGIMILASLTGGTNVQPTTASPPPSSGRALPAAVVIGNKSKSTGNVANDRLLALPKHEQALALGEVAGEGCVGNRAFYSGISKARSAFWSVGCTDGNSFLVQIEPDPMGSTTVLECSVLTAVAKMNCFKKITSE
jgi:hypothetical protein